MTKKITLFLFLLFLLPLPAFSGIIERYCFQEPNGTFYDLRGGKLGKKAFTMQVSNVFCPAQPLTGIATLAKISSGYSVVMLVSRDVPEACVSYMVTALTDVNLVSLNGNYDNLPRNFPPDDNFGASRVACPVPFGPVETGQPGPGPGAGKKSE